MQYQFDKFSVVYGGKAYGEGWEGIFGKRCAIHNVKLDAEGACPKCKARATDSGSGEQEK